MAGQYFFWKVEYCNLAAFPFIDYEQSLFPLKDSQVRRTRE